MKKLKGILVCLTLVCILATCATSPGQDAMSEIDTTEAAVSVQAAVEPEAEPAPAIPEPIVEPEPVAEPAPAIPEPIAEPEPVVPPAVTGLIEMVLVGGGSFELGRNLGTGGGSDVTPVSTVTLTSFYIGKYQVTQEQYQEVMGSNPSWFHGGSGREPAAGEVQEKRPVESVSWYNTIVFCNKLSMIEGLTPAYSISGSINPDDWGAVPTSRNATWDAVQIVPGSTGYRLPTEAQWEYAAKGGDGSPGSYTYSGSNNADEVAWYSGNSGSRTHEVGKKAPNFLGLYDMSGNVWEWCWDWWGSYTSTAKTDPTGAVSGNGRVMRGGCWDNSAEFIRSAYRNVSYPSSRFDFIGFRVVRPVQ